MRHFDRTPEPAGASVSNKKGHSYVIQKHDASHLHYDFRLELDGVLLSWAVPKGPSLKAGERRLAMRTEDHPVAYGSFEGIIPEGEYGGGTVLLWDQGSWTPEGDARAGLKKGHLAFTLHGKKLGGRWHLVRTHVNKGKESWLLFKSNDAAANADIDIVEAKPKSVVSGRTIAQIEKNPQKTWHSKRGQSGAKTESLSALVQKLPTKIAFSNLDKVLYAESGLTKGALVAYYATMGKTMLRHMAHRPLSVVRCPNGRGKPCFFQKHAKTEPDAIVRGEEYMSVHSLDGLYALAQLGVLEIHTWGCHEDQLEKPDQLVFDIDPDEGMAWSKIVDAAVDLRTLLTKLGLETFVKTTGGKGLHVVAPIQRRVDWDTFKAFSKAVAVRMEQMHPDRYVTNPLKKLRKGKLFIDYLRNGRTATAIAPYSTRAREGATVATPITWEELAAGIDPKDFSILTVPKREGDAWDDYFDVKQALTQRMRRAVGAP